MQLRLDQAHYEKYWKVFGSGSLGAKAGQLFDKSPLIEQAGFLSHLRAVLAMDYGERIGQRGFGDREISDVDLVRKMFDGKPYLVVRSSANGDAEGTGAYESIFCRNDPTSIVNAVKAVLASENSPRAVAFRNAAGLDPGMAVIIEPVIGDFYNTHLEQKYLAKFLAERKTNSAKLIFHEQFGCYRLEFFAPDISGFGFTSTGIMDGMGYIKFVPGLPSLAVRGQGEKLRFDEIDGQILNRYFGICRMARNCELQGLTHVINEEGILDDVITLLRSAHEATPAEYFCKCSGALYSFTLVELKEKIERLRQLVGESYFEWAGVQNGVDTVSHKPIESYSLLQIAGINPIRDTFEFPPHPENVVFFTGGETYGSGKVVCKDVFWVCGDESLEQLPEFNRTHKNYAIIISAGYVSGSSEQIDFSNFDNTGAIMIFGAPRYGGTVEGHWGGFLRKIGKITICDRVDSTGFVQLLMEKMGLPVPESVYDLPFQFDAKLEVMASESQRKGLITLVK